MLGSAPVGRRYLTYPATWHPAALAAPAPERTRALANWETAPAARVAHPREEHLLPLMVALGAAEGDAAKRTYHENEFMGGISVSNFMFGLPDAAT